MRKLRLLELLIKKQNFQKAVLSKKVKELSVRLSSELKTQDMLKHYLNDYQVHLAKKGKQGILCEEMMGSYVFLKSIDNVLDEQSQKIQRIEQAKLQQYQFLKQVSAKKEVMEKTFEKNKRDFFSKRERE